MPSAEAKTLLKLLACGSVDDGKSTVIGRLLYDCNLIADDELAALDRDSRKFGHGGGGTDFALLLDGLEAEREQGITIDIAWRYFATARRSFIIADAPGHEEYTRNFASAASAADAAVLLLDATKGVLIQTKRHATIAALFGIRHFVLAINKMDLVGWSQQCFGEIVAQFRRFAENLQSVTIAPVPLSARFGDNVVRRSVQMPWYTGPALLEHLERIETDGNATRNPLRFGVQLVNRSGHDFRGFAGTVLSGVMEQGEEIAVAPSGSRARVSRIVTQDGDLGCAVAQQAVTVVLSDEIDVSRGAMLCRPNEPCECADQFAAHILWFSQEEMFPHRDYLIKLNHQTVAGRITALKHRIEVDTQEHAAARTLQLNEIASINVSTNIPVAFDPYRDNRETGGFIVIDRKDNSTVGAGVIDFPLRRAANVHWHALDIDAAARASLNGQKPCVLWFTGLSGAGKSTIANLVEKRLFAEGRRTYLLDGDNVRHGLKRDLGFTDADRIENIRRVTEVARLFVDAGLITLVAFISPFAAERQSARETFRRGEFHEIFVDTPLEICSARDPKGLYARAATGLLKNFTGIDSPYEAPRNPELVLSTTTAPAAELANRVVEYLKAQRVIP